MNNFDTDKHPRGHASNPGAFSEKPNSAPDAVLELPAPVYNPADGYYTSLEFVKDPRTSAQTLAFVLEHEDEDDFYHAIATHPNATAAILDKAAGHSSYWVREAVVANPNTGRDTLMNIRAATRLASGRAGVALRRQGVNPGNQQLEWEIKSAETLIDNCNLALAQTAEREAGLASETDLAVHRERRQVDALLDGCAGLGGTPLNDNTRSRIQSLCANPTDVAWQHARGIMIDGATTLWQAVEATRKHTRAELLSEVRDIGFAFAPTRAEIIAALTDAIASTPVSTA